MGAGGNHPIDDFLRAIHNEKTAILAGNGSEEDKIAIRDGELVAADGTSFEYVFSAGKWKADNGSSFLIRPSSSRQEWAPAEALPLPDGKVHVRTTADLGRTPRHAQLRTDGTTLLESLAERIAAAGAGDSVVNRTIADWILGEGTPAIGHCADADRFIKDYRSLHLNDRQRLAIEHALASDVTFIWGPPGTGKTEVVSRIIEGCFRQGMKVLLLVPTNVAIDQALERVCGLLAGEEGFEAGLVQRAGDITLPSLEDKFGSSISLNQITSRLAAGLAQRAAQIQDRLTLIRADIELHQQAQAAATELAERRVRRDGLSGEVSAAESTYQRELAAAAAARASLEQIGTPSGWRAEHELRKIHDLREEAAQHDKTAERFQEERQRSANALQRCRDAVTATERKFAEYAARLSRVEPLDRIRDVERRMTDELSAIDDERRKIDDLVRSRCRVMGATVVRAVQSRALMDEVDVVVIDEAGMIALPWVWCAAGFASKRVVVAGDFRQLPAVTHGSANKTASSADIQHSRLWMDRDAFTAAGLVDSDGAARPDARMICLNSQYRMRPTICTVVNEVAYPDAPLGTLRDDTSRLPPSPLLPGPLILVDTTSRRVPYAAGRHDAHKSNPVHQAVIHELVRGLQYDKVLPGRKWTDLPPGDRATDRMAVIAPYRAQAKALQIGLRHRFGEEYHGLVDTIHRFQGSQRPLVVLDTVAGAGRKLGLFYEGTGLSSATSRLLNVALSRAQDHLIVVADVEFLERHVPPGGGAARVLDSLKRHAHRLRVDDLIPVRSAADLAGLPVEDLDRPAFFPADEVPRAVEWDIGRATKSIDIYCPFLDPRPVRKWLRHLSPRLSDGITVTVLTRPQEEGTPAAQLVHELRTAGCQLLMRERMHEKVLIIDGTVLWHGSLNLLANTGPTDLMMRVTDADACEQVRRIMTTARMDRPARKPWGAANSPRTPVVKDVVAGEVLDGRLYLNVPREEKEEAKKIAQARWNRERQLWHVDASTPHAKVQRWLPPTCQP